ncbi:MAG: serine hydrolase domain-containing protein [Gemmataceae bacterium]
MPSTASCGPAQKIDQKSVQAALEKALAEHKVPALGAVVLTPDGEVGAVVGVRKRGSDVKATFLDQWHLGSDSKAMTAMLIAVLVHKKLVRYDSTLAEVFPELAGKMHDDYKPVTVEQLLRHRASLPSNLPFLWHLFPPKGPTNQQRERATKMLLSSKPPLKPDTKFQYSNAGYTVAGHVAEQVGKATWEELMKRHVFDPLGMKSAGFGAPGTAEKVDQPWPHDSAGKPVKPGPGADNPEVISPAGRVHCSLGDWAKFVRDVMNGAEGKDGLLPAGAYKKLVEPAEGEAYTAGGWGRGKAPVGYSLGHDGSNTMNYCTAAAFPKAGVAVLVVCNQGGDAGSAAARDVRRALVQALFPNK